MKYIYTIEVCAVENRRLSSKSSRKRALQVQEENPYSSYSSKIIQVRGRLKIWPLRRNLLLRRERRGGRGSGAGTIYALPWLAPRGGPSFIFPANGLDFRSCLLGSSSPFLFLFPSPSSSLRSLSSFIFAKLIPTQPTIFHPFLFHNTPLRVTLGILPTTLTPHPATTLPLPARVAAVNPAADLWNNT